MSRLTTRVLLTTMLPEAGGLAEAQGLAALVTMLPDAGGLAVAVGVAMGALVCRGQRKLERQEQRQKQQRQQAASCR